MKIIFENRELNLPDFLIIGAMRSGTTSLYNYLSSHHGIFMPSLKEPQFFSYYGDQFSPHPPEIRKNPWTLADYARLFIPAENGQIIGEASTSYIYIYPGTLDNIKKIYGRLFLKLKIIGVLRNPIDRAWSIYSLKRQGGTWKKDFSYYAEQFEREGNKYQYYNFLASGLYNEQVKAYQETFPSTKFILFDELKKDPERVVKECLEFIGTKEIYIPREVGTVYNYSGIPKNKFFDIFHRLLFRRSPVKNRLKRIIPENIRFEVKRRLGSYISKKEQMPLETRRYLTEKFKEDLFQLTDLLKDERQRTIIKRWIT